MDELHKMERDLEAQLKKVWPDHPALGFIYHGTNAAITAYSLALYGYEEPVAASDEPNTGAPVRM